MPDQYTLRKGEIEDLSALKALFAATVESFCSADYSPIQIEVWASGIEKNDRWIDMITNQLVIVAHNRNEIVGFATLVDFQYIDFFYVHKDHQRKGIADKLYAAIEKEAIKNQQIELKADVSITAKGFFEKSGFEVLAEQRVFRKGIELMNYKMKKIIIL